MIPRFPNPDLLVECAQGFVPGWTKTAMLEYITHAVAAERERIARLLDIPPEIHGETEDILRELAKTIRASR